MRNRGHLFFIELLTQDTRYRGIEQALKLRLPVRRPPISRLEVG
jgi:hypothetical protein